MKSSLRFLLICLAAWLLAGCGPSGKRTGGIVSVHGQLSVREGRLTDRKGEPFQLRGMSTHGINWFPEYLNEDAVRSVKEAGGNVLRVAMYTQAAGGYLEDPERNLTLVKEAVRLAKGADLYVLIDWHILDDGDPTEHADEAMTFFGEIASSFPQDPAVLYEICNEPNGCSWDRILAYAEAVLPVIRDSSPDAVVVIGTPSFSSDLSGPEVRPYPDENVLYAYHFYAGLHRSRQTLVNALQKHLPVMVSEWGIALDADGKPALGAGEEFASYLNENGISWCAWSLCAKDEVYSAIRPDSDKTGGWTRDDLTLVGQILFDALKGSAQ